MKINFLITGLLGLITVTAFAQKRELTTAQGEYSKYQTLKGNKATGALALNSLKTAKESIDKASANDKTSALPLTYALKGSIYASIAFNDTIPATSIPNFTIAEEALKKAKELDTKGENKKMLEDANIIMAYYKLNQGVKEYGNKKFDLAYKSFDYSREILQDTTSTYYAGLAAANADNWDGAIQNYTRLLSTNYSKKLSVYQDLSNFYLNKKDTAAAIKITNEAAEKYPNDPSFSKRSIEMSLQTGKQAEVLAKIEGAIAKDPKNKSLYYYAGITYTQVADEANNKLIALKKQAAAAAKSAAPSTAKTTGAKTPVGAKPAAAAPAVSPQMADLIKTRDDYFAKAESVYRKALEIDPNYFEANLNLGYVMINPAIDLFNTTRNLPPSQQKEYDAGMAKANAMFDAAKPYLQKAVDLNPKSIDALANLRTYYLGKNDIAHASELKKQIEALNGK